MRAYQAYSPDGHVTAETPRDAAMAFFATFPQKRKCNVIEGTSDGRFFSVAYGRQSAGQRPTSWKDVTKKTATYLPAEVK